MAHSGAVCAARNGASEMMMLQAERESVAKALADRIEQACGAHSLPSLLAAFAEVLHRRQSATFAEEEEGAK